MTDISFNSLVDNYPKLVNYDYSYVTKFIKLKFGRISLFCRRYNIPRSSLYSLSYGTIRPSFYIVCILLYLGYFDFIPMR